MGRTRSGGRVRRLGAAALLAAGLAAAGALRAQEPAPAQDPQQPTFRTGVDLVRVDVSVTGRGDQPVADLTADDFEVFEDGVRQRVETVQFVRLDGTRTSDTTESLDIRSPEHAAMEARREDVRLFAIFLDDYHIDKKPHLTLPLRDALTEFVEALGPNDLVALMDPLTPLDAVAFTRSKADLLERIRSFEGRRGELFPVRSVLEESQLATRNVWELRAGVSLSALHALAVHMGGLREGRKSILFVSQGPPLFRFTSTNYMRLEDALKAANRGNVTIHVLDPRPLGSAPIGGSEAMARLSYETGGRNITNTNDPSKQLAGVIADASAYYLLGYSPERERADGKFHEIDVKVKRRGVRVVARRGYWAPSAEEMTAAPAPAPEPAVASALKTLVVPESGRVADVWIGTARAEGRDTRVTVSWEPGASARGETPASVTVEPVQPGAEATAIAPAQTIGSATAAGEAARVAAFELAPAEVALRFTARDAKGDVIDQWTEPLVVPAFDGEALALATPRVLRARSPFEWRALQADPSPAPAATRRFRPSDRVLVEIEPYLNGGAPPAIVAALLNQQGDRLLALDVPPLEGGRTRVALPVASLAPSTYLLRIVATRDGEEVQYVLAFRVAQ